MTEVRLDGQKYDAKRLIEVLSPQVTPERLERIEHVINGRNKNLITVMENIYDRGNTSAVMRSAEAFGYHLFHQVISFDDFKESKRVTQGADKWLLKRQWPNTLECVTALKNQGHKIYVTHLEGGRPIEDVAFDQPVALFFGNERDGASKELTDAADEKIFIPMKGFVQSFNISVAAALCFQHISREHRTHNPPILSDEERQHLKALYLYRSIRNPHLMRLS